MKKFLMALLFIVSTLMSMLCIANVAINDTRKQVGEKVLYENEWHTALFFSVSIIVLLILLMIADNRRWKRRRRR